MTPRARHPLETLLVILGGGGGRKVALAAALQLAERLSIAGAALTLASRGREATVAVLVGAGVVVFLHRVACAALRVHTQAKVLEALAAGLLFDTDGLAESVSAEAEMSLVEGMYAADRVIGQRLPELVGDAPACVLLATLVFLREPASVVLEAGAVVAAGATAVLLVRDVAARQVDRVWQALLPALEDLLTAMHGRLEVVGNGGELAFLAGLTHKLREWRARSRSAGVLAFVAGRVPALAAAATAGLLLLWRGGWGDTSLASAALLASVVPAFAGLGRGILDLRRDLVRARPVVRTLDARPPPGEDSRAEAHLPADIAWSGISFSYAGQDSPTLQDVHAIWRPGELLALAGHNGSGKSTLVRLLLGLHTPGEGAITVGGAPLPELSLRSLRRRVAYLVQRPFLPDRMTVGEAIHLLAPHATTPDIERTLARVGLLAVLSRRRGEAALDVKLGSLSAGEKQRIAIARVLLRDVPLLLLDEPDANLDAEGVSLLAELLREELRTRMVLVIAHSPALLASADRVVRFEAGRVVRG